MKPLFVGIEGPIGVGKSTLSIALAQRFGWHVQHEPVETNPYLAHFYGKAEGVSMAEGMRRWTFPMQIHLLHARYLLHQGARFDPNGVVQDRTLWGDTVFARDHHRTGLMSDLEWTTYRLAWEAMLQTVTYPDAVVFLDAPIDTLQERIQGPAGRGRAEEAGIPDAYLEGLRGGYDELFQELVLHTPCKRFEWSDPNVLVDAVADFLVDVAEKDAFPWAKRRARSI